MDLIQNLKFNHVCTVTWHVNVNVKDTIFWLSPTIESCNWIDFISVAYASWYHWNCGRTQRKAATINQLACPSYSLYVQLLWYPMYYPGGIDWLIELILHRDTATEGCVSNDFFWHSLDDSPASYLTNPWIPLKHRRTKAAQLKCCMSGQSVVYDTELWCRYDVCCSAD